MKSALKGSVGLVFLLWGFAPAIVAAPIGLFHLSGGVAGLRAFVVLAIIASTISQYLWSVQLLGRVENDETSRGAWAIPLTLFGLFVNAIVFSAGCSYMASRAFHNLSAGV